MIRSRAFPIRRLADAAGAVVVEFAALETAAASSAFNEINHSPHPCGNTIPAETIPNNRQGTPQQVTPGGAVNPDTSTAELPRHLADNGRPRDLGDPLPQVRRSIR